jgi:tetratricopeptide (TPR) repeat protein
MVSKDDIFISYAHKDIEHARELRKHLHEKGCSVFMDESRIAPGARLSREIERALTESRVTIVLCSDHAHNSDWVDNEVKRTLELETEDQAKHCLVPIVFPGSKRLLDLENRKYIRCDACDDTYNWQKVADDLVKWKPWLAGPTRFPPRPDIANQSAFVGQLCDKIWRGEVTILTGQYGIGKSTIAQEAAYVAQRPDRILDKVWIDCKPDMSLEQCLCQVMRALSGDYPSTSNLQDIKDSVVARCREVRRALIVLDEFDTVCDDDEYLTWLNDIDPCVSILLIACDRPDRLRAASLQVPFLSAKDAAEYLARQAKAQNAEWPNEDSASMMRLCEEVRTQPLVLKGLVGYVATLPVKEVHEHWQELVAPSPDSTESKEQRVHHELFLGKYHSVSNSAQHLLARLSVFPHGVRLDIIGEIAEGRDWRQSMNVLGSLKLVQIIEDPPAQKRYIVEAGHKVSLRNVLGDTYRDIKCEMARRFLTIARDKAEGMSPLRKFAERIKTLDWFEAEWDTLYACVDTALHEDKLGEAQRLVCDLSDRLCDFFFIRGHGHAEECKNLLDEILRLRDSIPDKTIEDKRGLMHTYRNLGLWHEDSDFSEAALSEAARCYDQSVRFAQEVGDEESEARALYGLANARSRIAQKPQQADQPIEPVGVLDSDDLPTSPEELFDMSINLLKKGTANGIYLGIALAYQGAHFTRTYRWEEAKTALNDARAIMRECDDRFGEGIQLLTLGNLHLKLDEFRESEDMTRRSIGVFGEVKDRRRYFAACTTLARALFWQGKWPEAEREFGNAQNEAEALGNPLQKAMTKRDLGQLYTETGRWSDAERLFTESIDMCRASRHEVVREKGVALRYFSDLYALWCKWDDTEEKNREAMETGKTVNDDISIGHCMIIKGRILCGRHKPEEALQECLKGLESIKEVKEKKKEPLFDWANALRVQALALQLKGDLRRAEEVYNTSRTHLAAYSSPWNTAKTLLGLAEVYRDLAKAYGNEEYWKQSEDCYKESCEIFKNQGILFQQGRVLVSWAQSRRDHGDIRDALGLASTAVSILRDAEDVDTLKEAERLQGDLGDVIPDSEPK